MNIANSSIDAATDEWVVIKLGVNGRSLQKSYDVTEM